MGQGTLELPSGQRLEDHELVQLPPGYRFLPTDQELIGYYLLNKVLGQAMMMRMRRLIPIREQTLYGKDAQEPQQLFQRKGCFDKDELYFYTKIKRKFDRGSRIDRVVGNGTWKTQNTTEVHSREEPRKVIGFKTTLNFEKKGYKESWIMHEYSLFAYGENQEPWVVCRIKRGRNNINPAPALRLEGVVKNRNDDEAESNLKRKRCDMPTMVSSVPSTSSTHYNAEARPSAPTPATAYNKAELSQQIHNNQSYLRPQKQIRPSNDPRLGAQMSNLIPPGSKPGYTTNNIMAGASMPTAEYNIEDIHAGILMPPHVNGNQEFNMCSQVIHSTFYSLGPYKRQTPPAQPTSMMIPTPGRSSDNSVHT